MPEESKIKQKNEKEIVNSQFQKRECKVNNEYPLFHKAEEDFECIDETDGQSISITVARARPTVESMLARSLAWQFLKQYGL